MKKTIISLFAAALALVGCSGFLEENPTTQLSESSVFATEDAIQANLTGCYQAFQSNKLWKGEWNEILMPGSAMISWKGKNRTSEDYVSDNFFTQYSTGSKQTDTFKALFTGINRCNNVIDNMKSGSAGASEEFCKEVEAEARFLRGVLYFTAVRFYGDLPLLDKATGGIEEAHSPRTHFAQIYKFILEDFTYAEENMRDRARQEQVTPGENRPDKWAATAFKSSVYLTLGGLLSAPEDNFWDTSKPGRTPDFSDIGIKSSADAFTLAYESAKKVIDSGNYKLEADYRKLFKWTDPEDFLLNEGIFVLQNNSLTTSYLALRGLPQGYGHSTKNSNSGRWRPSRWAIDNFIKYSGGTYGSGSYNKVVYAETPDPRFDASYITSFYDAYNNKSYETYPLNNANAFKKHDDNINEPYCQKYYDPTYAGTNGNFGYYVMRYAEVYLIAAEAASRLSTSLGDDWAQKAFENVNVIRTRARKSTDTGAETAQPANYTASSFNTLEEMQDAIWWERWIELGCEGHEWFDTHRYGATWLRDKIALPVNEFWRSPYQSFVAAALHQGRNVADGIFESDVQNIRKGLLFAYPLEEISQNTSLTSADQNDFYWM